MAVGFRDPVGSGKVTAANDGDGFYNAGRFLSKDGDSYDKRHLAADWNAEKGADSLELAYAAYTGTVAYAAVNAGSDRGGVVMLNHILPDGSKYTTLYMHLEHIPQYILNYAISLVTVPQGALLGDSASVSGRPPHIHYEIREGHQKGLAGVGFGYVGGNTGASVVDDGSINGVSFADIRNADGSVVRYFDPVQFTNKYRTVSEPVGQRSDLTVMNASINDDTVRIGQEVRVEWEVKNAGKGSATGSVAGIYLSKDTIWSNSDIRVGGDTTSSLAGGRSDTGEGDTITVPTSVSPGTWYVLVVADEGRAVTEGNEENNVWSKKITVSASSSGRPDLVIQDARIDDTTVKPGQEVRAEWEVANIGSGKASATVAGIFLSKDATWSSSDIRVDFNGTSALAAGDADTGESDSFIVPKSLASGTWYVLIVADYERAVTEGNENNNVWSRKITVGGGSNGSQSALMLADGTSMDASSVGESRAAEAQPFDFLFDGDRLAPGMANGGGRSDIDRVLDVLAMPNTDINPGRADRLPSELNWSSESGILPIAFDFF